MLSFFFIIDFKNNIFNPVKATQEVQITIFCAGKENIKANSESNQLILLKFCLCIKMSTFIFRDEPTGGFNASFAAWNLGAVLF
jgi:hypothetical protein